MEMEYVRVTKVTDLPENRMIVVDVGGKEVLLANVGGAFYAIANKCPHMGGSLVYGTLEGTCVSCPRHGATFDLQTGRNLEGAKVGFLKIKLKDTDCFPVKVEGEEILVGTQKLVELE